VPNTIVELDPSAVEYHPGGTHVFSMRGSPVLKEGKWMRTLSTTEDLWLHVKIYAAGGERKLHRHVAEDHSFVVLQGGAMFEFDDGARVHVGPYDGVMIPRGARYCFAAEGSENLVMLRVGAGHAPGSRGIGDLPHDPQLLGPRDIEDRREGRGPRRPTLRRRGRGLARRAVSDRPWTR
jgi:mannose-6-phosphate isomerase-like protein (cupin superfamily)